jgi:ankyrin repeat protein
MIVKSKEAACLLLRHGANPNAIGPEGEFALGSAIDNPEVIKVLLGAGADVTLKMGNGLTILDYAKKIPNPEVKKIILNHKHYENKTECRPSN